MKILILGANRYADWFIGLYDSLPETLASVEKADLIIFTGGSDVHPAMYKHKKHSTTYSDKDRDLKEHLIYAKALENKIPMLGICRGSQFLTACQKGGCLIQNVSGHASGGMHEIIFNDGEKFWITSTHHQMMYPFDVENYELIAWASPKLSEKYEFGDKTLYTLPLEKEPEIVFYPDTKCFCIQGHPEMMNATGNTCNKLKELIRKKLSL